MKVALILIVLIFGIGCRKDNCYIPDHLQITSQADIDGYAKVLCNTTSIGTLGFETTEPLDLSAFKDITHIDHFSPKNCEQVSAFEQLESVKSLFIKHFPEGCAHLEFPNLREVDEILDLTANHHLKSIAFPKLEIVDVLNITSNENLESIANMRSLKVVNKIFMTSMPNLKTINGFQDCTSEKENSYYQIFFQNPIDIGDAFTNLKFINQIKLFALGGIDLDWIGSIGEANILGFKGPIDPNALCAAKELVISDEDLSIALSSTLSGTEVLYSRDYILENCD